ncbi:MAG: sugar ABC transporter substrate-binding protein [Streptosporangiaceae bacterium]
MGVWIACVGLLAAACGSSATSAGTSGGSGGSGSGSAASISSQGVAQATALVGKYLGDPAFVAPGPSINVAALKGKSILSVPANSLVPFVATVDGVMKGYAQDLGMKYTIYTNQQQLGQWVQGMNQAISTKASAIDLLSGIPPDLLKAQVQQAQAAGIPTVDTNERDPSQPTVPYVAAYAFAPFNLAGQLMSAWAVEQTKGKADVLVVTSNEDTSSAAVQAGITQELRTVCGGCKESAVNVNPEDWAKSLQTTVEGKLSADPNINYILPVFDSMAQYIAPGIIAAGKSGKVHVASFNGTPSILDMIRSGDIVTMDVGENTSDVAAAGLDQIMRIMLHQPVGKEQINVRVLDKSNVADAGVPAVSGKGYGDAFMTGYATTWGVSPSLLGG